MNIEKLFEISLIEAIVSPKINRHRGRCEFGGKLATDRNGTLNCTKCLQRLCAHHRHKKYEKKKQYTT